MRVGGPVGCCLIDTRVSIAKSDANQILTDQLRRQQGIPKAAAAPGRRDLLRAIAVLPTDYGLLCLSFLLFGAPAVFFGWYGLLLLANAVLLAVAARSWVRQLSSVTKGS